MKLLPELTPDLTTWALAQPVFFIASAPLYGRHVNVSPKGQPSSTLSVLAPSRVAYLDRTGSGCETVAHLHEPGNGRATLMFMSVGPNPRILRLWCRGRVIEWDEPDFDVWLGRMGHARPPAVRALVVLDVLAVGVSCGYGVPRVRRGLYAKGVAGGSEGTKSDEDVEIEGLDPEDGGGEGTEKKWRGENELSVFEERPTLADRARWRAKHGKVLSYQVEVNLDSLDGLPGLRAARRANGEWLWVGDTRAWARRVAAQREGLLVGFLLAMMLWSVGHVVFGRGVSLW